jgi:hypothetical protein
MLMRAREITGGLLILALWSCALPATESEHTETVAAATPAPAPQHPGDSTPDAPNPCLAPAALDANGKLISVPAECNAMEQDRGDPADPAAASRAWQHATISD